MSADRVAERGVRIIDGLEREDARNAGNQRGSMVTQGTMQQDEAKLTQ